MKKLLSLIIAVAIIIATLPIGSGVVVNAACASGTTDLLEFGNYLLQAGSESEWYDSVLADKGETGTVDNPIIIDSAEEFVCIAKGKATNTAGKYYKVADGISAFDLSKGNLNYNGTLAENLDRIMSCGKNHTGGSPGFQGTFDGNGVTVYGAWTNHNEGNIAQYAGLFNCTAGNVTIKNINVRLSYFVGKTSAGGIVGYYKGDGTTSLTIENCSVVDCYIESMQSGYGSGTGAIFGFADNYVDTNGPVKVNNCFVKLEEKYFISAAETQAVESVHGGLGGVAVTNTPDKFTNCIVIGIKPYSSYNLGFTSNNNHQHTAGSYNFENIYTDQEVGSAVSVGGNNYSPQDYTSKIKQLTDAEMKGAAAVDNMDLDWSVWMANDTGYPELRSSHKNISYISNKDGTHSETCICGFGSTKIACTFENGKCTVCELQSACSKKQTIYWDGQIASSFADQSSGTKDDPVIINTAAELAYLITSNQDVSTLSDGSPKYFKIANGIGSIVLQRSSYAEAIMKLDSASAVRAYFEDTSKQLYSWPNMGYEQSSFCGYFDGNGAKIYGLYQASTNNAGLFSSIDAGASIHNIAVLNSYFNTTTTKYQIGAIAAVGNGIDYGIKTNGVIWFDSCIVGNCYMRSKVSDDYANQRSGIIIGNAYEDSVVIDNCFVYGNDAYYGETYQHKIALVGYARNNVTATSKKPAELTVNIEENVDGTGVSMFYNSVRNTVVLGSDIVNTRMHCGFRFNEPDCFENCYTDGVSGHVEFTNGYWDYTDTQIKAVTINDFKNLTIGNAWVTTNTLPVLKVFHFWNALDNGDGTHTLTCDCGINGQPEAHISSEPKQKNIIEPTCTTNGSYNLVCYCTECYQEVSNETVELDMIGHSYEDDLDTTCDNCGEAREPITFGDVNNDNDINNKDFAFLMRHINRWNISVVHEACDTDRDGEIDNNDCSLLMQYINGWDVCIHTYIAASCTLPKSCINCDQTIGAELGHNYVAGECARVNKGVLCSDFSKDYCPKLYFTGNMTNMTQKTDVRNITFEYRSREQTLTGAAKIKVQGTSSLSYDKKNYTIKFYEDEDYENKLGVNVGWGAQNEYCLKANWIDKTHSRNVVSAKIASKVQDKYGLFKTAPNNGVIDGFPIEVYIDGNFHGLYTMNIPKADWMFAMDEDDKNHIVICGENWNAPVLFKAEPNLDDWSVEVGPENDETLSKINRLYTFIHDSTDAEFVKNFDQYLNLDSTLNYYIMMNYGWMADNAGKNMLLATYDGNVWYPTLYDLDTTWGTHWTGTYLYGYESGYVDTNRNLLWERVSKLYKTQITQRYFELRKDILDEENVMKTFTDFYNSIPQEVLDREMEKWGPNIPGYDLSQIQHYLDTVIYRLDNRFSTW